MADFAASGMKQNEKMFRDAFESLSTGNLSAAERLFKTVLADDPKHIGALNLLTIALMRMQRNEEAEQFAKAAIDADRTSDITFYNYGLILKAINRPHDDLVQFDEALALNAGVAETWNNRGTIFNDLKRYSDAISDFDKAVLLNPNYAEAFCNKGNSLNRLKRYDEALAAYGRALALNPGFSEASAGRGNSFALLKRYDEAFAAYDEALALKPGMAEAWLGRGKIFVSLKRYDEAFAVYDRALTFKPDLAEAWNGRGGVLTELRRYDEALAAYDRALAIKANLAEAWLGRGNVYSDLARYSDALDCFARAQDISPELGEIQVGEACCRLLQGEFERGWEKYESRWDTEQAADWKRNFSQPLWLGDSSIANKTILLHAEQGLGDAIIACRYVPMVAALGARIILEVQPPLLTLVQNIKGDLEVIAKGDTIPAFDCHCPLMSLPLAFKTRFGTIPAKIPYLKASESSVEKWRSRLVEGGFKVGIAWAGNPNFGKDSNRSILLKNILPVLSVRGPTFYSIQKDLRDGDREILNANSQLVHLGDAIDDCEDTAAIMMSLDLVLSSDTSVVNLAGALGVPTWVLLSRNPDWRWLLDRSDSPWYPTARLFRQSKNGEWGTVVNEVCAQLEKEVSATHTGR